jgi:hypothetical protein
VHLEYGTVSDCGASGVATGMSRASSSPSQLDKVVRNKVGSHPGSGELGAHELCKMRAALKQAGILLSQVPARHVHCMQ